MIQIILNQEIKSFDFLNLFIFKFGKIKKKVFYKYRKNSILTVVLRSHPGKFEPYQPSVSTVATKNADEEGELDDEEEDKMQTDSRTIASGSNKPVYEEFIRLNKHAKECILIDVFNPSPKTISVGSHFHFIEANKLLQFDRALAHGMRLVIGNF